MPFGDQVLYPNLRVLVAVVLLRGTSLVQEWTRTFNTCRLVVYILPSTKSSLQHAGIAKHTNAPTQHYNFSYQFNFCRYSTFCPYTAQRMFFPEYYFGTESKTVFQHDLFFNIDVQCRWRRITSPTMYGTSTIVRVDMAVLGEL